MKKIAGGSQYLVDGKSHYQRNRQEYIDRAALRKTANVRYVQKIKQRSICADCGWSDWRCLEFDHLPEFDKVRDIASDHCMSWGRARIDAEIAKCEIVCANCHRIRTYTRRLSHVS